jgi:hypothetical protein
MSLPVPFRNEVDGNLVADHARRDRRHVSARGVRCRKEAVLLPGIERWAVLPTEHFSHNEDEYCSATDQRANLDDERAWMNGD